MIVDGVNVLPKEKKEGLKFSGTWAVWAKLKKGTRLFCVVSGLKISEAIAVAVDKQNDQKASEIYNFHVEADYKPEKQSRR